MPQVDDILSTIRRVRLGSGGDRRAGQACPASLAGTVIREGAPLVLPFAAGNRDPEPSPIPTARSRPGRHPAGRR
ncbi:hypothetical protein, partial [Methylobacterium aquaticum]|uniref:hypothetical protein n=1 Tax=Methylobacterium aquaticum TaxID=270351 RepID=UPI001AEBB05B